MRKVKHNMIEHRMNKIWRIMRQRCNNPNNQAYVHYKGKGITVCQKWDSSFVPFMGWTSANGLDSRRNLNYFKRKTE